MNKQRRKQISELFSKLDEIVADLETLRDEEQEYYDNMPESIQGSDRGTAAEEAISHLDDAVNAAQEARSALENIE